MDSGARKASRFLLSQGPVSLYILGLLSPLKRSISSLGEYVRLSSLGSWNRIPYPAGLVKNRSIFLTVSEAGSLRSGASRARILMRTSSGLQTAVFSLCPYTAGKRLESSVESLLLGQWGPEPARAGCGECVSEFTLEGGPCPLAPSPMGEGLPQAVLSFVCFKATHALSATQLPEGEREAKARCYQVLIPCRAGGCNRGKSQRWAERTRDGAQEACGAGRLSGS